VSHKAKKKHHVHVQPMQLLMCYLQVPHCENCKHCNSVILRATTLSYYRTNTFLLCRISKPKMNELGATVDKNQPFWLLWHPFPHQRLKLDCFERISIVTRELIPFLCRISKPKSNTIRSTTFIMWPLILHPLTKINLDWSFLFLHTLCALVFSKNEVDNLWIFVLDVLCNLF